MSSHSAGARNGGPVLTEPQFDDFLLPAPAPSRRVVDPAQRALLLLATQFKQHRMVLLQSETLLQALDQALEERDTAPEELVAGMIAAGPPDPASPVESLIGRLRTLVAVPHEAARPRTDLPSASSAAGPPDPESPVESLLGPLRPPVVIQQEPAPPAASRHVPPTSFAVGRVDTAPAAPAAAPMSAPAAAPAPAPAPAPAAPPESASPASAAASDVAGGPIPGYVPRRLARARQNTASRGWRASVRHVTGGTVRLRPGRDEAVENALINRIQAPMRGYRHVVVLSLKGGSGKTTTTVMLGHTFATHRRDRVTAIDASPDTGTLAYRIADQPTTSVRTLLEAEDGLRRYVDVRPLTGHATSRLELVASEVDPTTSRPFGAAEYRRAADLLSRFYSLVLTDCGAGLVQEAMRSVLDSADQIVLVTTPAVDSARSADRTLDWLEAHGYSGLVRGCVVVVNSVAKPHVVDVPEMVEHFGGRCRAVAQIPRDPHLAEGAATDLALVSPETRRSYLVLAAAVADGFGDAPVRRGRVR